MTYDKYIIYPVIRDALTVARLNKLSRYNGHTNYSRNTLAVIRKIINGKYL